MAIRIEFPIGHNGQRNFTGGPGVKMPDGSRFALDNNVVWGGRIFFLTFPERLLSLFLQYKKGSDQEKNL